VTIQKPHSKYPHLYVVVRLDDSIPSWNELAIVSAWFTEVLAEAEVQRLNQLRRGQAQYRVMITRLKEAIFVQENVDNDH